MRVADIMDTAPATVQPHQPIEDVLRVLQESEQNGVVVVNDSDHCIGIITEADLVLSGEEADLHLPHYVQLFGGLIFLEPLKHFEERLRKAAASKARDLMTDDPITIAADASLEDAAGVIADSGHNRIPVVDGERLVGVVTRVDVLQALARR